jgi:hypothetical protein
METGKISKVHSRYICRTEHIIDDITRYIFIINYDRHEQSAKFTLDDGWNIEILHGNATIDKSVTLRGNDGVVLIARKKQL